MKNRIKLKAAIALLVAAAGTMSIGVRAETPPEAESPKQDPNVISCDPEHVKEYVDLIRSGRPKDELHMLEFVQAKTKWFFCHTHLLFAQNTPAIFLSRFGFRSLKLTMDLLKTLSEHPGHPDQFCTEIESQHKSFVKDIDSLLKTAPSPELEKLKKNFSVYADKLNDRLGPNKVKANCRNIYMEWNVALTTGKDPESTPTMTHDLCEWRKKVEAYDPKNPAARLGNTRGFPNEFGACKELNEGDSVYQELPAPRVWGVTL